MMTSIPYKCILVTRLPVRYNIFTDAHALGEDINNLAQTREIRVVH